jgi:glycosyltransferase involved in cell wall biosynthesis
MTNDGIVMLYAPPWDAPSQMSKHHLARHWARHGPVLYVESPANPLSLLTRPAEASRLLRRYLRGPTRVADQLWVQAYFSPLPYHGRSLLGARWVNTLNQQVIRPQLHRLLRRLGFRHPIVVAGGAHALPLLAGWSPRLLVYHCSDDYTRQPTFPRSFRALEHDFIRRCDLIITTAEALRRAKAHLHPHVHAVSNGAEVEHFAQTQHPQTVPAPELMGLPRPIVGYIGTIFEWIDQEMIAQAARARPQWSFVFVGPCTTSLGRLRGLGNVHLIGPRPYRDLPGYLKAFDVAMVPFVRHDVTMRASPIKFYEYLASGVPVVATRLPDFEPLGHLAELVAAPAEFVPAIERAILTNTSPARAMRMTEARRHSWEARFAQIDRLIGQALADRERRREPAGR